MLQLIVEQKVEIKELCKEIKTKLGVCSNSTKAPEGFKILATWEETINLDIKLECIDLKIKQCCNTSSLL